MNASHVMQELAVMTVQAKGLRTACQHFQRMQQGRPEPQKSYPDTSNAISFSS